jgi:hypothetical protein
MAKASGRYVMVGFKDADLFFLPRNINYYSEPSGATLADVKEEAQKLVVSGECWKVIVSEWKGEMNRSASWGPPDA